ncbi:MAG: hypothetical protein LEGION0398_MBIBDBAK_00838 [Legionellaceae bacterium]
MKKYYFAFITLLLITFSSISLSYAENQNKEVLIAADKIVLNLSKSLKALSEKTNIPIVFPTVLPMDDEVKQYYVNTDVAEKPIDYDFMISISAIPDCNGAPVCNLGYLFAKKKGKPHWVKNSIAETHKVNLVNKVTGYFTPAYSGGGFFPPTLEWKDNDILYNLSWGIAPKQAELTLIEMANSAIKNQNKK